MSRSSRDYLNQQGNHMRAALKAAGYQEKAAAISNAEKKFSALPESRLC